MNPTAASQTCAGTMDCDSDRAPVEDARPVTQTENPHARKHLAPCVAHVRVIRQTTDYRKDLRATAEGSRSNPPRMQARPSRAQRSATQPQTPAARCSDEAT